MRCFTENKYIFGKSHFADEERLRRRGENSETERQIHICEVSLRGRRETSEKKDFGQIHIMKSHFAEGEDFGEKT